VSVKLDQDINQLKTTKVRRLEALRRCDEFLASATDEAAYGIGFAFFGRMRAAAGTPSLQSLKSLTSGRV